MKTKIKLKLLLFAVFFIAVSSVNAQSYLKSKERKAYKCGYVYKPSFFSKLKPMKLISKLAGNLVKARDKSDLSEVALSIAYGSNSAPNHNLDFSTKTDGWETCGDAVSVVFFNYTGVGFTDTDGEVKLNGKVLENAGMGTYYQGFPADERGNKKVEITSSNGDKVEVNFEPLPALEILTVNGKTKDEDIVIDGSEDVIIELKDGDLDKDAQLYVNIVISAMSMKVNTTLFISDATNKIVIPKEAFKNYANSPLPIIDKNTLVVTKVKDEIIYGTDAGIIQKITSFSDFAPVLMQGKMTKGNAITNTLNKDKNTKVDGKFRTIEGEYNFEIDKGNAFDHPPISRMKKVGISSFVVRGNLFQERTTESERTDYNANTITKTKTTIKKWFPELSDESWQKFVNNMYDGFVKQLKTDLNVEVIDANKMIKAKAYSEMIPIKDTVTKTFIEKGAYGTTRLMSTDVFDFSQLKMTFVDDYTNEKLIKELDLSGLIAVTIDLNFDLDSEGLNPKIKIVAFSPNTSSNTTGKYFGLDADTKAKPFKDANKYNKLTGGPEDVIYKVMKADDFFKAFSLAIQEIKKGEIENPAYERIWKDRTK